MDRYKIDGHKLIYHIQRVHDWLEGKTIYPIYMEISASGACNHRCTYCGLDFMGYKPRYLDRGMLKERVTELGDLAIKSVMYAGEGEPFLHPHMTEIINHTKKSGIDVAVTTNGVLFNKEIIEKTLGDIEWVKVSVDAATKDTYAKLHRTNPNDFAKVIEHITYAVRLKKKKKYRCTLGLQLLLLPENCQEAIPLANLARDIGVDYLVIKPYSQHPQSKTRTYASIKYCDYEYLAEGLTKLNTKDFNVIFRKKTMKQWDDRERHYRRCFALSFWAYIDAGGNVWGCGAFLGDKRFLYGNIYKQPFQKIWEGEKRHVSLKWVEKEMNISNCRVNCRMDAVNSYLWDLKHLPEHVNFI